MSLGQIAAAIAGLAAIAVPLIRWWLRRTSQRRKNQEIAYEKMSEKIDADAPADDVLLDINDLINGMH